MFDVLKLYCNGYIAAPLLDSCWKLGLFKLLSKDEFKEISWLKGELSANVGRCALALQALEVLGLVEGSSTGGFRLTTEISDSDFNGDLTSIYQLDYQRSPYNELKRIGYQNQLEHLFMESKTNSSPVLKLRRAAVLTPLLCFLSNPDCNFSIKTLSQHNKALGELVEKIFVDQKLLTARKKVSTKRMEQLLDSGNFNRLVSYQYTLAYLTERQFFGNDKDVHYKNSADVSKLKHDMFIGDSVYEDSVSGLLGRVVDVFEKSTAVHYPQTLVQFDCRNGQLLKDISDAVASHPRIQQKLLNTPLNLIGVEDEISLRDIAQTSMSKLIGDGRVGRIVSKEDFQQLKATGQLLVNKQTLVILPFRAKLDETNVSVDDALEVLATKQETFYCNAQGELLKPVQILSAWQHCLRKIADNLNDAGVILLQAHSTQDQHDLLLDMLSRIAGEHRIAAASLHVLAARVGLFNHSIPTRYPASGKNCDLSIHHFTKREYVIRHALISDLDRLDALEKMCWQHTRTSRSKLAERIEKYPQGQFVLEKDNTVVGVVYSQRIADETRLDHASADNVQELHDASGEVIQLLAINIDPEMQNFGYGDQLLEFILQNSALAYNVNRVVGVTLCKKYQANRGVAFVDYIRQQGVEQDPVLAFHQSHGAMVVKALANYRPEDVVNEKHGVLVAYDIHHRIVNKQASADSLAEQRRSSIDEKEIESLVKGSILKSLGELKNNFLPDRPLMEMGLDSADLLKLQNLLEAQLQTKLNTAFFFEFNSFEKVIGAFKEKLGGVQQSVAIASGREVAMASQKSTQRSRHAVATEAKQGARQQLNFCPEDIAIIGMSCKLPGGIEHPDLLWQTLIAEQCKIGSYPSSRGTWPSGVLMPGIDQGGFVENADKFDPSFFRISPLEAEITDPQQRMLLQLSWACFEDAGILPESLKGSETGVFVGASNSDYSRLTQDAKTSIEAHHATGSSLAVLANRLSYFYDFSGPSLLIDTACSSSLVALHSAVRSLRSGECCTALVGGVNLICHPDLSVAYHKAGMLSHDARCKVFDASASGYVRAEGGVVLLLKPLARAEVDGDQIHAVLKGSAINHGGLAAGLTVPNPLKQSELLRDAWRDAGVSFHDLGYIEAHGTGTSLGDPIEVQGILSAFSSDQTGEYKNACGIGSVKSNLGHLESAAGITGLLKVVLCLKHKQIAASINFSKLNPKIEIEESHLYVANKLANWTSNNPALRESAVSALAEPMSMLLSKNTLASKLASKVLLRF